MRKEIYAMVVVVPVNFPAELELRIVPMSRKTERSLGGSFTLMDHRSWDWVRDHYPVRLDYLDEVEGYLRLGESANLVRGETVIEVPDNTVFPEGIDD